MNKKNIVLYTLLFFNGFLYAIPSVAVLDFNSGNYCTAEKAVAMTALFRSDLVRSGRIGVVDRQNMDPIIAEYKFEMSDWVNADRIKPFGKLIGADYLMTGTFGMLGDTLYLVVQMIDLETALAVHSARMTLGTWDEYDWKVYIFAQEFIEKIPIKNIFTGLWSADIIHDGIIDTYEITFIDASRCRIRITSLHDGSELTEEIPGTYSYDGATLKVTAVLRNSRIPHITTIRWASAVSIDEGNTSFHMLAKPSSTSSIQVRVTFTKK
jgi:TolB-like protein